MRLSVAASALALAGSVVANDASLTTRSSASKTKRSLPVVSVEGNGKPPRPYPPLSPCASD